MVPLTGRIPTGISALPLVRFTVNSEPSAKVTVTLPVASLGFISTTTTTLLSSFTTGSLMIISASYLSTV